MGRPKSFSASHDCEASAWLWNYTASSAYQAPCKSLGNDVKIKSLVPTSLHHAHVSLVSAQKCHACLGVNLAVQHSPCSANAHLAVQTLNWLFKHPLWPIKHSFGCSSIQVGCSHSHLAVQTLIWLLKHSVRLFKTSSGCSNLDLAVQAFSLAVQNLIWLFKL